MERERERAAGTSSIADWAIGRAENKNQKFASTRRLDTNAHTHTHHTHTAVARASDAHHLL